MSEEQDQEQQCQNLIVYVTIGQLIGAAVLTFVVFFLLEICKEFFIKPYSEKNNLSKFIAKFKTNPYWRAMLPEIRKNRGEEPVIITKYEDLEAKDVPSVVVHM